MENRAFVFMGRSGSGKGTQAALLAKYLTERDGRKILRIETGQVFRDLAKDQNNYTAGMIKEILDEGDFMPAFMPIWIWAGYLYDNYTGAEHIIFDGTARKVFEANVLDTALQFYFTEKPAIIYLDVSDEWSTQHLLTRGRNDDNAEDIKSRLDSFNEDERPALDFFMSKPETFDYYNINGQLEIEDVHKEIVKNVFS